MAKRDKSAPASGEPAGQRGRSQMFRFVACFSLCFLLGFGLLLAPFTQPAVTRGTADMVKLCAGLVRLFGGRAAAQQDFLINPATGFSIEVKDTCNASNVTLILWAAMLSFPAPWFQKGKGLAAGTAAIYFLNLLRVVSLFYLAEYNAAWFEFIHLYVWESLIMLAALVIFSVWVRQVRRAERLAARE